MARIRPLLLHESALSPAEYDHYQPLLAQTEQLSPATVSQLWDWLKVRLSDTVDRSVESQILSFFKQSLNDRMTQPEQIVLALLRYFSHSLTSKHLLRDHLFIAADPADFQLDAGDEKSSTGNPFHSQSGYGQNKVGAGANNAGNSVVGRDPPPPLPYKRASITTISNQVEFPPSSSSSPRSPLGTSSPTFPSIGSSNNPFRARTISSHCSPSTSFPSFHSASTTTPSSIALPMSPPLSTTTESRSAVASPPLPPRPRGSSPSRPPPRKNPSSSGHARFPSSSSAPSGFAPSPPPIPVRRSSVPSNNGNHSTSNAAPPIPTPPLPSSSSTFAIISSSSNTSPSKSPKPPKRISTTSQTKLVGSTHIGPATRLRTGSDDIATSSLGHATVGRMSRSNSYSSSSVASSATDQTHIANTSTAVRGSSVAFGGKGGWTIESVGGNSSTVNSGRNTPRKHREVEEEVVGEVGEVDAVSVKTDPNPRIGGAAPTSGAMGLNRSKTLGSKAPPPPPKRRPQSMNFSSGSPTLSQNPFESPSSVNAVSGHSNAQKTRLELEKLLERSGNKSEEWISKAKEGGIGIVRRASGGAGLRGRGMGSRYEKEGLVSSAHEDSPEEMRGIVGLGYSDLGGEVDEDEDGDEDEEKEDEAEWERVREQVMKERERDEVMENDGVGWKRLGGEETGA